ncbi:MAG: hypothetical protein JW871_05985 [Endomicrobiales bacterium]|nr:hypothetical protein [Endomicrobiales bacterium]
MARVWLYLIILLIEIILIVILQSINYYESYEILARTTMVLVTALIIGTALIGAIGSVITALVEKVDILLEKIGFSIVEKRNKELLGVILIVIISNATIHGFISTKPTVSSRFIRRKNIDKATLVSLATINFENYEKIASKLNVYINIKSIKKIQKLAIERMEDQKEILEAAKELSKSYIPGMSEDETNGFEVLVKKLYAKGRQDVIYSLYKHIMSLNKNSADFIGGSALAVTVRSLDKREILEEILRAKDTPNFCLEIVKKKLQKK